MRQLAFPDLSGVVEFNPASLHARCARCGWSHSAHDHGTHLTLEMANEPQDQYATALVNCKAFVADTEHRVTTSLSGLEGHTQQRFDLIGDK